MQIGQVSKFQSGQLARQVEEGVGGSFQIWPLVSDDSLLEILDDWPRQSFWCVGIEEEL